MTCIINPVNEIIPAKIARPSRMLCRAVDNELRQEQGLSLIITSARPRKTITDPTGKISSESNKNSRGEDNSKT